MAEHMTVCGGHLSADEAPTQLFSHAKFGDINYDNKEDCDWIIEAPHGKNVHLNFLTFELEDEQDCGYDFIEVGDCVRNVNDPSRSFIVPGEGPLLGLLVQVPTSVPISCLLTMFKCFQKGKGCSRGLLPAL